MNHAYLPLEPAWYRRAISIPASAKYKRLWLEFDGVYRNSYMWLNGRFLGGHYSGYTSFRFDVTDFVEPDKDNVLTVRVDPTAFEGWWYEGGGIYRHVRLIETDPIHIATEGGVFVSASVPDVGSGIKANSTLDVQTVLSNANNKATEAVLLSEVLDSMGAVVAQSHATQSLTASTQTLLTQKIPLKSATLWSLENPYRYTLRSTVLVNDKPVDQVKTNFGVRTIRFDADRGFFLNGKQVKIKGTCNHQDHAGVGIAMPERLMEWRLERLKEMGSNAYRCSHNAVAPELLDMCDRMGMLVMDENRKLGDTRERLDEVVNMVKRDRNHPSIIIWSMCNEETHFQGTKHGAAILNVMRDTTRLYDTTRPVSCAMNGGWFEPGLATAEDIVGFNYYPEQYDRYHKEHPKTPLYGSETASEVLSRGIYTHQQGASGYFGDKPKGYVSEYGVSKPGEVQISERTWRAIAEREFMAGSFIWTGFDYKGEPYPYGWPCINSHFGIMDTCGFPKDAYYYYQAAWSGKPTIHIMPHWNWTGQEGQEIEVWVHNNCKRVELFLNGESLGVQDSQPNQKLVWKVKYAPGKLEAHGTMADGKEIKTAVETTGEPAAVVLEADRTKLTADGVDLSMITVKIVDDKGRRVPVANNEVTFNVMGAGKLIGVGNGDPSCHDSDKSDKRKAFGGLCQAIVQANKTEGTITLTASSPNLKSATVILQVKK
ncbi:TPA: beta-galactosidase [Candidatus Sumerlaeota bacterium]|nr:beta-galactosidase [Candidatus Sumerlaeota bacterium]